MARLVGQDRAVDRAEQRAGQRIDALLLLRREGFVLHHEVQRDHAGDRRGGRPARIGEADRLSLMLALRVAADGPRRGQVVGYTAHPLVQLEDELVPLARSPARYRERMQRRLALLFA